MTEIENLVLTLGEECAEVAQRCSKALRFGLHEVEPGQELNNIQRIEQEMCDLFTIAHMLSVRTDFRMSAVFDIEQTAAKQARVYKAMEISRREGTLV